MLVGNGIAGLFGFPQEIGELLPNVLSMGGCCWGEVKASLMSLPFNCWEAGGAYLGLLPSEVWRPTELFFLREANSPAHGLLFPGILERESHI